MITSCMVKKPFFMNSIYPLVVLYMMGPVIPIQHATLKLPADHAGTR